MKNLFHSKTQIVYGVLAIVAILMIQTSRIAQKQKTADQTFLSSKDAVREVEQNLAADTVRDLEQKLAADAVRDLEQKLAADAVRDLEQNLAAISGFNVETLANFDALACDSQETLGNYKYYNPTLQNVAAYLTALQAIDLDSSRYSKLPPTVRQAFDALQTSCADLYSTFCAYKCDETMFNDILVTRDVFAGFVSIANFFDALSGNQTTDEWQNNQEGINNLHEILGSVTFINYNNQISKIVPKAKAFQSCYYNLIQTIATYR